MSGLEQEIEKLKKENKKLSLESKLRKSMAVELDRQKDLLRKATEEVEAQKEKIEGISLIRADVFSLIDFCLRSK